MTCWLKKTGIAAAMSVLACLKLAAAEPPPAVTAGARAMRERIEKVIVETNPLDNLFMNEERAEAYRASLARATTPGSVFDLHTRLAIELLNAGRTEESIREFENIEAFLKRNRSLAGSKNRAHLRHYQALCYLRLAEQDNCLTNHTSESCLFPIRGGGIHKNQRGSRKAIEILTDHLARSTKDLSAVWLLNVAYMTLGEYPHKVPAKWLLDPKWIESDHDIKRFPDIAAGVGLDLNDLAGGCVTEDFDNDGDLDLMISTWALRGQLRLFLSNGDGSYAERTEEAGLRGEVGGLNLIQTDYNNDGHADVLILRGAWMSVAGKYPNSLLRNNGDGTFSDVTVEAGLLSFHPTQTAAWVDYNGDGWLDLFIGNESVGPSVNPCELFRNNGDGTFTECAAKTGLAFVGFVKAVASGDYNNDGRPDLYLSCKAQPNVLFRNDGPGASKDEWKFNDVTQSAGVAEPLHSFPTWFFDYDNDGWLDLLVTGYLMKDLGDAVLDYQNLPHGSEEARLYRNKGDGTFADVTQSTRMDKMIQAMGANFGDLDNDGYLDLYFGTGDPDLSTLLPNRMFRNAEGRFFQEVTASGGFGHLQKGHAISFADLDNDGDQDIYSVIGGAYSGDIYRNVLFENPGHGNRWITLQLIGTKSNRAAVGARIKVTVATPGGERIICKQVGTGGSFGASPLRQEIGLGQATAISQVEILWPSGEKQVVTGLKLDAFHRIREGAKAEPWDVKPFKFALKPGGHAHHHH